LANNSNSLLSADLGAPESNAIQASGTPDRCPDTTDLVCRLFAFVPPPARVDEVEIAATSASATVASDTSSVRSQPASSPAIGTSLTTSNSTSSSSSGSAETADRPRETPGRAIALVLTSQKSGKVLRGKTDAAGRYTFAGLAKGETFTLSIDAKNPAQYGDPEPIKAAVSAPAEWQAAHSSSNAAASSPGLSVTGGLLYSIRIDYLKSIEIVFRHSDGTPHAGWDGKYTVENASGTLWARKLATDENGLTAVDIAVDAQRISVGLTLPKKTYRYYLLMLDASGNQVAEYRKQYRGRCHAVSSSGKSEVVDLAECAGTDNCVGCAYSGGHSRIEQVILGGYTQLGLVSNFDNDNQTGRYDVLGGFNDSTISRKELESARALFRIPPPDSAWHADIEKLPECEAGLVYVSGGRAAGLGVYLSASPLAIWCLANGYCCDIVVDFLEYEKYCDAVKASIAQIAEAVAEYANGRSLVPRPDDDYPKQWPAASAASKPVAGGAASKGKNSSKPAPSQKPVAQPASYQSSSSSSSSSGGSAIPATVVWEAHVKNRLRVISTLKEGLEELPRGFGFNRHVAMLWMLKRYTHLCATVDDNTLGFTANTYGVMDWLFKPGNISDSVPAAASSSSSHSATKGSQEKWLALALKPCTVPPKDRGAPAVRASDAIGTAATAVLKPCLNGKQIIQQMTVWNVTAYRALHTYVGDLNYDVSFVTGKEDIDFHSRLLNSAVTTNMMFETASIALVKCNTWADEKRSSDLKTKDDAITKALLDRIRKLSPCFRRMYAERSVVLREVERHFYDEERVPEELKIADLARRINKAIEQMLATGKPPA
jgi:hypothetical protein